ncbi:hypothetical protein GALMADRAFT_132345 [Galerina marginata CBS 339.88]|uniref:Uncharacterized protein n=1 Tax=Galerina marginata (strain CBS 339.88) TaxID=685588 RepID=A0A067TR66_GALM3|nr:hypothetical protein GALMADRAFT_132345 [Galerina marginata CBS 339.88]
MPRKTLDETTHDPQSAHLNEGNDSTSILIFVSAKALGSLGFAVSLLAIWFGWLLPASITGPTPPATPGELDITKPRLPSKHPRRSAPNGHVGPLPVPIRRASAPVDLTPILVPRSEEAQVTPRRVYFTDSPPSPIIRRNTMPEPKHNYAGQLLYQAILSSANVSPGSSTSTLPTQEPQATLECFDDGTPDSDSSLHSAKASLLKPSSRLQKLKLGFNKGHRPEPLDKQADQASIASTDTAASEKSARRASGSFVASFTLSRNRTAPDVTTESASPSPSRLSFARRMSPSRPATSPASAVPMSADVISPSFLSRKAQKRTSAPIPRTSPYGAPYFASPPLLLNTKNNNNYPAYLKGLPQFEDEVRSGSSQALDGDDAEPTRGRTSTIRRVNLNPAPRNIPKRRSASEDWTQRQTDDA